MIEPRAVARTGSNISREEREVENYQRTPLAHNSGSVPRSQEVQRLEWFRVLIFLLFAFLTFELSIRVLVFAAATGTPVVMLWDVTIRSLFIVGFYSIVYIGCFVVLTEYHSAIGAFLDRYLYFRRRCQPLCLRVLAYLYATCVFVRIGLLVGGFFMPWFWFL